MPIPAMRVAAVHDSDNITGFGCAQSHSIHCGVFLIGCLLDLATTAGAATNTVSLHYRSPIDDILIQWPMQILFKDWFGFDGFKFGFETRYSLNTAIGVAAGVHEAVFVILNLLT